MRDGKGHESAQRTVRVLLPGLEDSIARAVEHGDPGGNKVANGLVLCRRQARADAAARAVAKNNNVLHSQPAHRKLDRSTDRE